MKRHLLLVSTSVLLLLILLTSCLTINQKKTLPPPYRPVTRDTGAADSVLYLFSSKDNIDWDNINGVYALKLSHGLTYNEDDASALFKLASDNNRIYFNVTVKDDIIQTSEKSPADAWDTDSIEVFIGYDTNKHTALNNRDHAMRVSLTSSGPQLGLDNVLVKNSDVSYEYFDGGYIATWSVSLEDLGWPELRSGKDLRAEYAYNDADSLSRELKLQWTGNDDLAYADASKWKNVSVEEAK